MVFFLTALVTPFVILQSSLAVFYMVLDVSPRGVSPRLGAPTFEIFTVGLVLLIGTSFFLVLTRRVSGRGLGWTIPGLGTFLVLLGVFLDMIILSVRRDVERDRGADAAVSAAYQASDAILLIGAVLVVAVVLLAPIVASGRTSPRRLFRGLYIALCLGFVFYGVAPIVGLLSRFG